jgi:uncharacterized protein with ATP-grasp and redox domains
MGVTNMKTRLACILCILNQALKTARLVTGDTGIRERILRTIMSRLLEVKWDVSPAQIARSIRAFELIEEVTGIDDPYRDFKRRSNDEALSLLDKALKIVSEAEDPLMTAVKVAIAGNIIDVVTIDEYNLEEKIEEVLRKKPAINNYDKLRRDIMKSNTLLYFSDNAGEIVFDKLLIEEMIRARGKPFEKITFVVKGGPSINDATLEDALYIGVDKLPNIEIRTVSNGSPGTGPDPLSPEVLSWINSHDLVIAKGQGNYEDYSDVKGIYFLLIVKCPVVAEDLGVNVGDIVIRKG